MARNNLTGSEVQMESHKELLCSPSLAVGLQRQSTHLAVVNVTLSLTSILGNFPILVPCVNNFPSIRHPNFCIVVWKQLIFWLVSLASLSMLFIGYP